MQTNSRKTAAPSRLIGYARVSTEEQGTDPQVIKGETLRFTAGHRPSVLMSFLSRPDGSFSQLSSGGIRGPAVMIKGRIVGDVLDADVSNEPCAFHWHLTKKPRGE
jgi:hypothetical protein